MRPRSRLVTTSAATTAALLASLAAFSNGMSRSSPIPIPLVPDSMPAIGTVDERYLSYNVEMAEVIGGKFWKPYTPESIAAMRAKAQAAAASVSGGPGVQLGQDTTMYQARPPIDLASARLRTLAAALGPAYVRVSGSWASSVYFHDSDAPAPRTAPKGFDGVLTRAQWRGVVGFARAANAGLTTSFAITPGVRDAAGVWTPVQARKLVAYTKAIGGQIAAAEFFNEPDMPTYVGAPKGYDAAAYARDHAVFVRFARAAAPGMRIVGPSSVGEGVLMPLMGGVGAIPGYVKTTDMLAAAPRPSVDVFSYHFYPAASIRCAAMGPGAQTTPEAALSEEWLSRADRSFAYYVAGIRDRFQPSKPVWITELADAACGGNPWASTFLDTFRFVDDLGRLAKHSVSALFHNTLASSEYGLLDQATFAPRPNYWAALLWRRLMGTTVLDAGPSRPGLHLYAQCLRGHPGGVTLVAINTSRTEPASLDVPMAAERYTLTAPTLEDTHVQLNGRELALGAGDAIPALEGARVPAGRVALAPVSITFLTMSNARDAACR